MRKSAIFCGPHRPPIGSDFPAKAPVEIASARAHEQGRSAGVTLPSVRASAVLAVLSVAVLWICALWLWPGLPELIPVHFDAGGVPDRFGARTPFNWFLLPGIATVMGLLLAFGLPLWIRRLAASNSLLLHVPNKRDFTALSPESRVRAVEPMLVMLRLVAVEIALLFGILLCGCARIASGALQRLPPSLVWMSLVLMIGTALLSFPFSIAAVRRERARAQD